MGESKQGLLDALFRRDRNGSLTRLEDYWICDDDVSAAAQAIVT